MITSFAIYKYNLKLQLKYKEDLGDKLENIENDNAFLIGKIHIENFE